METNEHIADAVSTQPESSRKNVQILFNIRPHKLGGWQVVAYTEQEGQAEQIYAGKDALKHHALGQLEDLLATYLVDFNGNAEKMLAYLMSEGGK